MCRFDPIAKLFYILSRSGSILEFAQQRGEVARAAASREGVPEHKNDPYAPTASVVPLILIQIQIQIQSVLAADPLLV